MPGKLADVARQARVSEATVSRVLNGKPGISDATRQAVLKALDVIGYERPTHLRSRKARMVGLVVPELANPIFPAVAEVVAGALAQRGFNAVLCTRTGSMSEAQYVEMLLERQVSGMIFAGGQYAEADAPHDHYTRLKQLRLPVVLVNAAADRIDFPRVSTDDAVAMEKAYAHRLRLGSARARGGQGGAPCRAPGPGGRFRRRLRRLRADGLHGSPADDGAPADRGDRPGGGGDAGRTGRRVAGRRRGALLRARACCSRLHRRRAGCARLTQSVKKLQELVQFLQLADGSGTVGRHGAGRVDPPPRERARSRRSRCRGVVAECG